jgi:hypothetical protein
MSRRTHSLLTVSVLLPLMAMLLALQAAFDSLILWILFVVVALAVFVTGVVSASLASRRSADTARLDELDPLRPDEESRR